MMGNKKISKQEQDALLEILKTRFEKNMKRHIGLEWAKIEAKLLVSNEKLWSINEMEKTGGEPDVVRFDNENDEYVFYDCSPESPKGRRSICYDNEALEARKEFKPKNSAIGLANEMGIKILTEEDYKALQKLGNFDTKTSSWILTPPNIRKLGGAIFADYRFETVFVYHNGAESYYGGRAFRGSICI
ncbi:MAG: DUF4256 domain-containing protein [Bacteroidota bacterium]